MKHMKITNLFSQKVRWIASLAIFLVSVFSATFISAVPHAFAAGETYTWSNNSTIHVTGGGLALSADLKSGTDNYGFHGSFRIKQYNCDALVTLEVNSDGTKGQLSVAPSTSVGGSVRNCTTSESSSYNNQQVTIQGGRPGSGTTETAAQRLVTITVNAAQKASDVTAQTVTIAITQNGKSVANVTANRDTVVTADPGETGNAVTFTGTTQLDAGTYHFCASQFGGCIDQTKIKGIALSFQMGTLYSNETIHGQVELKYLSPVDQDVDIAPIPLTLYKSDGTLIGTASTQEFKKSASTAQQQAGGSGTQNQNDITVGGADFTGIPAGDYKICANSINLCKTFSFDASQPLKVTLVPNDAQANQLANNALANQQSPTCENSSKDPLTWIICPIFNSLAGLSDWLLDNLIQPLLAVNPVSIDPNTGEFKIWSNFRIYGDILLVIALLVLVIGQSVGAGFFDAYTVKKMLPRILLCAILINVSIYIVAFAVDLSNIVGAGIGQLIIAPVKDSAQFTFTPNGIQAVGLVGGAAALGIGTFLTGILFTGVVSQAAAYIGLFVVLPALLSLIGAFITIILRQGLILFLILVSPVAFALYVFPNTEKYFRQWWEWLFKSLLVYPLIMVVFAIADVMTVMIQQANNLGNKPLLASVTSTSGTTAAGAASLVTNVVAGVVAFVVQFLPLALIPFAFRIAGGLVGRAHDLLQNRGKQISEGIKGDARDPLSLRNRTKRNLIAAATRGQHNAIQAGRGATAQYDKDGNFIGVTQPGRVARFRSRFAARLGGNVDERMSRYNKEAHERQEMLSATGDDSLIFAGGGYALTPGQSDFKGRTNNSGSTMFFNSKGKSITAGEYSEGKSKYGTTLQEYGQAFNHTIKKIQSDEDRNAFRYAFTKNAVDNNWSQADINAVWPTSTYPHKGPFASEWYSKPSVVKGAGGKTSDVSFADVTNDQGAYRSMASDMHRTRQSYMLAGDRDRDFRVMQKWQAQLERNLQGGDSFYQDQAKHTGKSADDLKRQDSEDLIRTYEIFDAASSQLGQTRPNMGEEGGIPQGATVASGTTPAAKPLIEAAVNTRAFTMTAPDLNNGGTRMLISNNKVYGQGIAGDRTL
jgi:hypothetical protein